MAVLDYDRGHAMFWDSQSWAPYVICHWNILSYQNERTNESPEFAISLMYFATGKLSETSVVFCQYGVTDGTRCKSWNWKVFKRFSDLPGNVEFWTVFILGSTRQQNEQLAIVDQYYFMLIFFAFYFIFIDR